MEMGEIQEMGDGNGGNGGWKRGNGGGNREPLIRFFPLPSLPPCPLPMPPTSSQTSNLITLRGSVDIVTEFFHYSVNSILYQRGIYPPETFKRVSHYGLSMMITTDDALIAYLANILRQLEGGNAIRLHN
jgi:hypothetical protein